MKYSDETYKQCAVLNRIGFGWNDKDAYSNMNTLKTYVENNNAGLFLVKVNGKIVAFLMWAFNGKSYETVRRVVAKTHRRMGLGSTLVNNLIKKAHDLGFDYTTYAGVWNIGSINSNLKCGCLVTKVTKDWVHMRAFHNE